MFTTRSTGRPFVGNRRGNTIQSDVAEVAWFIRGRTLHRRVLAGAPAEFLAAGTPPAIYTNYDISARLNCSGTIMVPNTLGDLTRRENRYAHQHVPNFPVRRWRYGSWTVRRGHNISHPADAQRMFYQRAGLLRC